MKRWKLFIVQTTKKSDEFANLEHEINFIFKIIILTFLKEGVQITLYFVHKGGYIWNIVQLKLMVVL